MQKERKTAATSKQNGRSKQTARFDAPRDREKEVVFVNVRTREGG